MNVAKYASISLNMPKYSWKCLNKFLQLCHCSEYEWSSYMFDRLLMISVVLNKLGFWIWHGCMCKGYAEFQICLIMAPNVSIILREYASISLNARQYAWQWLKKLFWPMPGLSICRNIVIINIIIIVTNVVILEFLSAWFAHHALLFFFLF